MTAARDQLRDARGARVLSTRAIVLGGLVLVLIAIGSAVALFLLLGGGTSREAARLDAIRTASSLVIGTGGAAALLLAARRQRSTELDLAQKDHDATERRVTELYGKAADQLGSDKAPVRLAGLYALERLAQANAEHRQTIVNVICAYLRMPFEPPQPERSRATRNRRYTSGVGSSAGELVVVTRGGAGVASSAQTVAQPVPDQRDVHEELQVRLAAQQILTSHLRPYGFLAYAEPLSNADSDVPTLPRFWDGMHLDLVGAYLTDFEFTHCQVSSANFTYAILDGETAFNGALFLGLTLFHGATFRRGAMFRGATFESGAGFGATFFRGAYFKDAKFEEESGLGGRFLGDAEFTGARFVDANFCCVYFAKEVIFDRAVFDGRVKFDSAEFIGDTSVDDAQVTDPQAAHSLPPGWTVEIDDQRVGRLVKPST